MTRPTKKRKPEQLSILTACGMSEDDVRSPVFRRLVPQGKLLRLEYFFDEEGRIVEAMTEVVDETQIPAAKVAAEGAESTAAVDSAVVGGQSSMEEVHSVASDEQTESDFPF